MIPHFEFWHPAIFEFPFKLYLGAKAIWHRVGFFDLLKINPVLPFSGFIQTTKWQIQKLFRQDVFPKTILINPQQQVSVREATAFAKAHGFPLILKPNQGSKGFGVRKISDKENLLSTLKSLHTPHLLQIFIPGEEFGIFYMRSSKGPKIFSINGKQLPTVIGDGFHTLSYLAEHHARFSKHWRAFMTQELENIIPAKGEKRPLSFIGSHTLGSMFTEESHLASAQLKKRVFEALEPAKGFNFGRLDVKSKDAKDLQEGNFIILEVNTIKSMPTNIYDPKYTLRDAYRILWSFADQTIALAKEHRHHVLPHANLYSLWKVYREEKNQINRLHEKNLAESK